MIIEGVVFLLVVICFTLPIYYTKCCCPDENDAHEILLID